jgi:DNA-binding MarR family transcriptional regulator
MTKKYLLVKELLGLLEEFEEIYPNSNIQIFSTWLHDKLKTNDSAKSGRTASVLEADISSHIGYLFRYAKIFSKSVLEKTPFQTLDDWGYCIVLLREQSLPKTELIKRNIHEKTTGIEIIKRLIAKKLVREFTDKEDNRIKRVSLTAFGRRSLQKTLAPMQKLAHKVCGNLSETEKQNLSALMRKLHIYHHPDYLKHIGR